MLKFFFLFACALAQSIHATSLDLKFPDKFLLGVSISGAQTEGAWNENGKGESIVDHHTHNYLRVTGENSTADVSSDFYHKYKDDIQLIKNLNVKVFSFSLSWSRIFPSGDPSEPNKDGVQFYHNVLNELIKKNITPFVTLLHWDHPQVFEDRFNGWQNEKMADVFADYARFVFQEYGEKVKNFVTIHEPQAFCQWGLTNTIYHQFKRNDISSETHYTCVHNMLQGHALAYRIYNKEFREKQNGQVGIVESCPFYYNKYENDKKAQERAIEKSWNGALHAIFSEDGDYSNLFKEIVANASNVKGLKSKLPKFNSTLINLIRNSSDFIGITHFTSYEVESLPLSDISTWPNDEGLHYAYNREWQSTQNEAMKIVPKGFRDVLKFLKNKYDRPIYVMNMGISDDSPFRDTSRINALYSYMEEMLKAINEDKCDVRALIVYSFLDDFDWHKGFGIKYGLVHVDAQKNRKLKNSAYWFQDVNTLRKLLPVCKLDDNKNTKICFEVRDVA